MKPDRHELKAEYERRSLRLESRLLIATRGVTRALDQVMKTFTTGYLDSGLVGAVADFRHAANLIESTNKEWRDTEAWYHEAVRAFEAEAKT